MQKHIELSNYWRTIILVCRLHRIGRYESPSNVSFEFSNQDYSKHYLVSTKFDWEIIDNSRKTANHMNILYVLNNKIALFTNMFIWL